MQLLNNRLHSATKECPCMPVKALLKGTVAAYNLEVAIQSWLQVSGLCSAGNRQDSEHLGT